MKFVYDDTVSACAGCKRKFFSGDVSVLFQHVISKAASFLCPDCTMRELETKGGARPTGAAVFLASKWKNVDIDDLPAETRERVLEGFGIVQRLASVLGTTE